ncbi:MAG: helix-turn-helix transcriptional regulator [Clostridia bacterium]|nr:helix-turn-helix transcriptional regulator [Clostridia bacterium]
MSGNGIYVSELSSSSHSFGSYHFCRGNSNKRKTRIGIIKKGRGTYTYLNKKLKVTEGDVVFIPENIFCYSEWHGTPDIEVLYINCFIHYKDNFYDPQIINCNEEIKNNLISVAHLLSSGPIETLEAYSLFYKILITILPNMSLSNISTDKTLAKAIAYITNNWNKISSVSEIAKECCVSESSLYNLFRNKIGQSPINFLNSIKINKAIELLENSNYSISMISQKTCFNSENHFRKVFSDVTGTTPLKFRKQS